MNHTSQNLKAFLQGDWSLTRKVTDIRSNSVAHMTGTALFKEHPKGLWYREQGQSEMSTYQGPFFQDYLYRFPATHKAEVCFTDGRLFYQFDVGENPCEVVHYCGRDQYQGRICIEENQCLNIEWLVLGPRKHYRVMTQMRNCSFFE
ncbi:MAG: DUF6314 family protein [Pseudomonadota bacterium]